MQARPFAACNAENPASTTLAELVVLNEEFEAALVKGSRSEGFRGKELKGFFPQLFELARAVFAAAEALIASINQGCSPMDDIGNNTMMVVTPSSDFFGNLICTPRNGMEA